MNKGIGLIDLIISIAIVVLIAMFSFDFFVGKKEDNKALKVKSDIRSARLNTFELSAKLILNTAETSYLIELGEKSCFDLMKLSIDDYEKCVVKFESDDVIIDIYGKKGSRFSGFHCIGTDTNMKCTAE